MAPRELGLSPASLQPPVLIGPVVLSAAQMGSDLLSAVMSLDVFFYVFKNLLSAILFFKGHFTLCPFWLSSRVHGS